MLICVPTAGNEGLEGKVHEHFGSAPYFTLCDSETNDVQVLDNRNAHHDHGTCHPMNQLGRYHIDCIVCGGMGRRAIEALSAEGIEVYMAKSNTAGEAVENMKGGRLEKIDPAKACRGHGQHGGCAHVDASDLNSVSGRGSGYGQGGGRGQGRGQGRGGSGAGGRN